MKKLLFVFVSALLLSSCTSNSDMADNVKPVSKGSARQDYGGGPLTYMGNGIWGASLNNFSFRFSGPEPQQAGTGNAIFNAISVEPGYIMDSRSNCVVAVFESLQGGRHQVEGYIASDDDSIEIVITYGGTTDGKVSSSVQLVGGKIVYKNGSYQLVSVDVNTDGGSSNPY